MQCHCFTYNSDGYVTIAFMITFSLLIRTFTLTQSGGVGARQIYERLLTGIVYSPMVFFETTPLGKFAFQMLAQFKVL